LILSCLSILIDLSRLCDTNKLGRQAGFGLMQFCPQNG
jgi:hypothetical protein